MTTPILPTDCEYITATYYIDLSAESPKALLDKLQAVHRDFEHFKGTVETESHGDAVVSELQALATKYFGNDLSYLFDDTDFSTKFPTMAAGDWAPETLAGCCYAVVSINEPNALYYETPVAFQVVPNNIIMATSGAGLEYHTVFSFVLYFWNGGEK